MEGERPTICEGCRGLGFCKLLSEVVALNLTQKLLAANGNHTTGPLAEFKIVGTIRRVGPVYIEAVANDCPNLRSGN